MRHSSFLIALVAPALSAFADLSKVVCEKPDGWQIAKTERAEAPGVTLVTVRLSRAEPAPPPAFSVGWTMPQVDVAHLWTPTPSRFGPCLTANWEQPFRSSAVFELPLMTLMSATERNRMTMGCTETVRPVTFGAGLVEETCCFGCSVGFFAEPEAPLAAYETTVRIDTRDVVWYEAVKDAARWMSSGENAPCVPPPLAYEPLYSTWYGFHQDVFADKLEAECARAAALGMKVLIVDDGWQTDDTNRGYSFTGDWRVSKRRFPDMAAHVRRVHEIGLKYMVWFGVPMVGRKSDNFARFEGKYLWVEDKKGSSYGCLDPRFPEVREHLASLYEKSARAWDLDGLKLDFIDAWSVLHGPDPAIAENYAGRDVKSVPEAAEKLLAEVLRRLRAFKPDFLVEFRQSYYGPRIRKYGNMVRAADCPGDAMTNRMRTLILRLTCPGTSVHGDMLEWHPDDSAEQAARQILACLFATVQYSMRLDALPPDHRRMMTHWMGFLKDHRETLLFGDLRPHHPEAQYPLVDAESAKEVVSAVYTPGTVVPVEAGKPAFVVNATGGAGVVVDCAAPARAALFDTFGNACGERDVPKGLSSLPVPVSGYARLERSNRE